MEIPAYVGFTEFLPKRTETRLGRQASLRTKESMSIECYASNQFSSLSVPSASDKVVVHQEICSFPGPFDYLESGLLFPPQTCGLTMTTPVAGVGTTFSDPRNYAQVMMPTILSDDVRGGRGIGRQRGSVGLGGNVKGAEVLHVGHAPGEGIRAAEGVRIRKGNGIELGGGGNVSVGLGNTEYKYDIATVLHEMENRICPDMETRFQRSEAMSTMMLKQVRDLNYSGTGKEFDSNSNQNETQKDSGWRAVAATIMNGKGQEGTYGVRIGKMNHLSDAHRYVDRFSLGTDAPSPKNVM